MLTRYVVISDRDNRLVVGPVKKGVANSELKRLTEEAGGNAPSSLNVPSEEAAENDPNAAAIREFMLAAGPSGPETFRIEPVELEREYEVGDDD